MKKLIFLYASLFLLALLPLALAGVIHVEGPRIAAIGGGASPTPSPTPTDHVADANARLSIDPTGKTSGYRVIQDDGPTTYEFQGDGLDTDAGLWVTNAGTTDYNGPYTFNGSDTYTLFPSSLHTCNDLGGGSWNFDSDPHFYSASDSESYAWQVVTWVKGSNVSNPVPTVSRDPMTSEANWTIIP